MPNQSIGYTAKTQDGRFRLNELLTKILFEVGHPRQMMPVELLSNNAVKAVGGSRASIGLEVSCHPQELYMDPSRPDDEPAKNDKAPSIEQLMEAGPEALDDREKWHLLTRELVQKQEIVTRLMNENDDKTQSLKLATAEIVDLRRAMKMMQSESQILRNKLGEQETAELSNLVSKEVSGMSNEELKTKIVKLAQAYRTERLRNEELQKALKSQNVDLSHAQRIITDFDTLQVAYKEQSNTLSLLTRESQKTGMYKETVKKQEQVISKLETLLEKLMRDRKIKDTQDSDNRWKANLETDARYLNSQEEQLKLQVRRQEQMIEDLRASQKNDKNWYGGSNTAE